MNQAACIPDGLVADVLAAHLVWEVDPDDVGWLRALFEEAFVYLRMNNFPDENLWSLWLGDGRFLDMEEMPPTWTRRGPLEWPSTARPRTRPYME